MTDHVDVKAAEIAAQWQAELETAIRALERSAEIARRAVETLKRLELYSRAARAQNIVGATQALARRLIENSEDE